MDLLQKNFLSIDEIICAWTKQNIVPFWKIPYLYTTVDTLCYMYLNRKYTDICSIVFGKSKWYLFYIPIFDRYRCFFVQLGNIYIDCSVHKQIELGLYAKKLVIIPIAIMNKSGLKGHSVVVVVNSKLGIIEYYDPNGSRFYISGKPDSRYQFILDGYDCIRKYFSQQSWFLKGNFCFLSVTETNPPYGIQYFGDGKIILEILPKLMRKRGWCMMYCIILMHCRLHFGDVSVLEELFHSQVPTFLLNYLLFIVDLINEHNSVYSHYEYPEHGPSFLVSKLIKLTSKPFQISGRNHTMNTASERSILDEMDEMDEISKLCKAYTQRCEEIQSSPKVRLRSEATEEELFDFYKRFPASNKG